MQHPPPPADAAVPGEPPPGAGGPEIATGGLRVGSALLGVAFAGAALFGVLVSAWFCFVAAQVPNSEATQGEFSSPPATWGEAGELVAVATIITLLTGAVAAGACAFLWFATTGRSLRRRTGVLIAVLPGALALLAILLALLIRSADAKPAAGLDPGAPDRARSAPVHRQTALTR